MSRFADFGVAGIRPDISAGEREWLYTASASPNNSPPVYLPGGRVIDGTLARDLANTPDITSLRPGLPMGKVTTSGKYANSIIGATTGAYADNDLVLQTSAAVAAEIVRRIGASGTVKLTGPPTAGGTVATVSVAYTAVNTTTGVLTVPDLNAAFVSGSLIRPSDGSEVIKGGLDEWVRVTDDYGTNQDTRMRKLCVAGFARAQQIIGYPADSSLIAWLKAQFNDPTNGPGPFRFAENF